VIVGWSHKIFRYLWRNLQKNEEYITKFMEKMEIHTTKEIG